MRLFRCGREMRQDSQPVSLAEWVPRFQLYLTLLLSFKGVVAINQHMSRTMAL